MENNFDFAQLLSGLFSALQNAQGNNNSRARVPEFQRTQHAIPVNTNPLADLLTSLFNGNNLPPINNNRNNVNNVLNDKLQNNIPQFSNNDNEAPSNNNIDALVNSLAKFVLPAIKGVAENESNNESNDNDNSVFDEMLRSCQNEAEEEPSYNNLDHLLDDDNNVPASVMKNNGNSQQALNLVGGLLALLAGLGRN